MKITLHIGLNKVGSSALQAYCAKHQTTLLEDHGVLYPNTGLGHANFGDGMHIGFSQAFTDLPQTLDGLSVDLATEIAAKSPREVLISSEFFVLQKDTEAVRRFFEGYDVRLLIYLRRHDAWAPSLYSQATKTVVHPPWGPGIEGFLDYHIERKRSYFYFGQLLDRWADAFGQDALTVRVNERSQVADVVQDALGILDAAEILESHPVEQGRMNASLLPYQLNLIEWLQRQSLENSLRGKLINVIMGHSSDDIPQEKQLLSPQQARELVDLHTEDYAYIARKYLNRPDGQLFYDPLPGEERAASASIGTKEGCS
jgi:hypothetical protein